MLPDEAVGRENLARTIAFKTLCVLLFIAHGRRELMHLAVTAPSGRGPKHLIRDRDRAYGR